MTSSNPTFYFELFQIVCCFNQILKKSSMRRLFLPLLVSFCFSVAFAQNFTLKSNDIEGQAQMKQVFNSFGCKGENISPQLSWSNAPAGTRSFAINMYDPDAPTGSGWWQWVIFDIPASVNHLVENAGNIDLNLAPSESIQSLNDYGGYGYGGPCPPVNGGIHEYIFTIYALKVPSLGLKVDANPAMVGFYINANTIQKASLVMYYERKSE